MFDNFLSYFNSKLIYDYEDSDSEIESFLRNFGGEQFGGGVFRVFAIDDIAYWENNVAIAYPDFANRFKLFAYDWLGRCFAIDMRDAQSERILMFEIGTNDVLEIPCTFLEFLNEEIPQYNNECLATDFYKEWIAHNGNRVKNKRCIGYKIPLFMGGADDIQNLEDIDMDVYWHIITQVKDKI